MREGRLSVEPANLSYDVVIVGGGSAGVAAAVGAAATGARTLCPGQDAHRPGRARILLKH